MQASDDLADLGQDVRRSIARFCSGRVDGVSDPCVVGDERGNVVVFVRCRSITGSPHALGGT